jgi:hypothetical protein
MVAGIYFTQGKFCIYNNYLAENSDANSLLNVFYSLNLLRTMLQLHKIKTQCQIVPKHYLNGLLSSLHCLL